MSKRIINILNKEGPMVSGVLKEKLVKTFEMKDSAARKAISRANFPVNKLNNISFNNNQKFIYLKDQYNSDLYFKNLLNSIREHAKAYYYFINSVKYHNGFIDKRQLPAYTSSTIKKLKGHRSAESIFNDLCKLDIIINYKDNVYKLNSIIYDEENYSRFKAVEMGKKFVMSDFEDWAKKINLISYNDAKLLNNTPEFYKFQWSFTAPSYVNGLREKNKPGFIVADILISKPVDISDIDYFISKINILKQSKGISSFIPFLITEGLKETAFKKIKSEGVVLGLLDKLFGDKYIETLKSLINVMENASAIISQNPDKYFELMDKLSEIEGKSINLRGDLFELAVGYYYSNFAQYIEINKCIRNKRSGKRKEIDVFVIYSPSEIKIIECKGYNYPLDYDYVEKWITDNVPTIRKWILDQDEYQNKNLTFEIWSTGGFEKSAEQLLEKRSKNTKKYKIKYLTGENIFEKAKEGKVKKFKNILNKHYR